MGTSMGGGIGSAGGSANTEPEYRPHVVAPNPEMRRARQAFQKAAGEKRNYWREEIDQLWGEFEGTDIGASLIRLAKEMGIELGKAPGDDCDTRHNDY